MTNETMITKNTKLTSVKDQREAVLSLWNKEPFYFSDVETIAWFLGISKNLVRYYLEKEGLSNT